MVIFVGLLILSIFGFLMKIKWLRYATLLVGLIYLGFIKNFYLSFVGLANVIAAKFMPILDYIHWYILVGLIVVITALFGRIYCGWICPFGGAQEFLWKVPIRVNVPPKIDFKARGIKYLLLLMVLTGVIITHNIAFGNYEPFDTLFRHLGTSVQWVVLIAVLATSSFLYRPFCRYLCLVGAIQALISKIGLIKLKVGKDCDGCGRCIKACSMTAIDIRQEEKIKINPFECIRCNRCRIVCPYGAIRLRI